MRVELLSHTPNGLDLLLRTKNTRLAVDENPADWSDEKKQDNLDYMRDTIKSSWEFVDYTFAIHGVTRAFTHQLVRTRTGSYAQEAMRVIDASGFETLVPPAVEADYSATLSWKRCMNAIDATYRALVELRVPRQDARGVLPTNVLTSIVAKFNLRTLHEMAKLRLCTRTQGEYQSVFRAMRALVIGVDPWTAEFIDVHCAATGTCAFPRYGKKECKFYDPRMDTTEVANDVRRIFWASEMQEANPILKDGKTM